MYTDDKIRHAWFFPFYSPTVGNEKGNHQKHIKIFFPTLYKRMVRFQGNLLNFKGFLTN